MQHIYPLANMLIPICLQHYTHSSAKPPQKSTPPYELTTRHAPRTLLVAINLNLTGLDGGVAEGAYFHAAEAPAAVGPAHRVALVFVEVEGVPVVEFAAFAVRAGVGEEG